MKPLAPNDALFFWIENRRMPMHAAGLQLYTPPEGAGPDYARELVESLRAHTQARPPYNQRAVFRLGHWFWEEDREFELEYHFRHSALPRPGRIRELLALVSRVHGALMDRSRPLWELNVIEGLADGRIAVYAKVHHAMFDGMAAMRALGAALSEAPDQSSPPLWAREPKRREKPAEAEAAEDGGLLGAILGAARAGADIVPGVRSGLWEILRSARKDSADATPFQAPPTILNVPISGSRRFAAEAYSLARFKAIGKAAGATVNDVSLAVCAGALRRYLASQDALPEKPLIAMVPVAVKAADVEIGNSVGVLLANLATDVEDPEERLARIVRSTTQAKERLARMSRMEQLAHAAALTSPLALAAATGIARRRPLFNVVISNVPGPKKPLYLGGLRLDEMYPVSIPFDYLALNITINGYCDQLGFGYTACRRSLPSMQRLLDHTKDSTEELETALGV